MQFRSLVVSAAIIVAISATGCTGASTGSTSTAPSADTDAEGPAPAAATEPLGASASATALPPSLDVTTSPLPAATATEPAIRVPENPGTLEATNWVARNSMDAESVELVWSLVENVDVYRVYRLPTADADYDAIQAGDLAGTALVYAGLDLGYIDRTVEPDVFLTYVLVAQVGNDLTSPRWTEALTVEDTTPPTPITGLTAQSVPDGVLLEWQPVTDNVEFASYSVSIVVDGEPQYIGGGADESQTSFLDTDTSAGPRTYIVTAVDFHNNRSEPAQIEITR